MDVTIDAIKFNHDLNSATIDALTIRKNEADDIEVPEWKRGNGKNPQTSAAAYANSQGNALTIAVLLKKPKSSKVQSVQVSATGSGILGNVVPGTVKFNDGQELSEWKVLKLDGARISDVGVGEWEVEWDWSLNPNVGSPVGQSTKHVIYTVRNLPHCPWGQPGDKPPYELPWADALKWACCWAAGAKEPAEIAEKITRAIYALGPKKLRFDSATGAYPRTTINGTTSFDCAAFLYVLQNDQKSMKVSCTDCAIFVSTFANLLGCDLYQSKMGPNFNTNPIKVIGSEKIKATNFDYHEVAWELPCTNSAKLFDSCLQVDGDSDPTDGDSDPTGKYFSPMLGINVRLGDHKGQDYHFRLAQHGPYGKDCHAKPNTKKRRPILQSKVAKADLDPEFERLLTNRHKFLSWKMPAIEKSLLFIWSGRGNCYPFLPAKPWALENSRCFKGEVGTPDVAELMCRSTDTDDVLLRVLIYQCASASEARAFLLNLMGEFQVPVLRRREPPLKESFASGIGDICFSGPEDTVFLFVRANMVVFVQNAGSRSVPLTDFVQELDVAIFSTPEFERPEFLEEPQFRVITSTFQVGQDVKIERIAKVEREGNTLHKFVTDSGEVLFYGDHLRYRPALPGDQSILVFGYREGRRTSRQVIRIAVDPNNDVRQPIELTSKQKEKSTMPTEVIGSWSSIMASPGDDQELPTDLTRDGGMEIESIHPDTGVVTGYYYDDSTGDRTPLYGSIRFGGGTYNWSVRHRIPGLTGKSRVYEGQLISEVNEVSLVGGRWRNINTPDLGPEEIERVGELKKAAQEEGVWVATKP